MRMRKVASGLLIAVLAASIGMVVVLLIWHRQEKETWATLTGLLAVIAAVISAWPALKVLGLQDDASLPRPVPCFDFSSRYSLAQLRVKNLGAGVAYDVHVRWKNHPRDYKGDEVTALDHISVLVPQESVSRLLGASNALFAKYSDLRFEGQVEFKDANGRIIRQDFVCSAEDHRGRLVHDEELPKALHDLQQVPQELESIANAIKQLHGVHHAGRRGTHLPHIT